MRQPATSASGAGGQVRVGEKKHLHIPGCGDDVEVEGLYDDVYAGQHEGGVGVAQAGRHVLLQLVGQDQRQPGVRQAKGHPASREVKVEVDIKSKPRQPKWVRSTCRVLLAIEVVPL